MTSARSIAPLVRKELRELGPIALAALVVLQVPRVLAGLDRDLTAMLYVAAALALGAMAVGHEFRHRTLDSLLSQPVPRAIVLGVKGAVLTGLLLLIGGVEWTASPVRGTLALLGPALCALCLAPALTMWCRNELAGMVFAAAVPAVLMVGSRAAAVFIAGPSALPQEIATLARGMFLPAFGVALAIGLGLGVRQFLRLEVVPASTTFSRPVEGFFRRRSSRRLSASPRRGVYWHLVAKELRLQQLPIAIAMLFSIGWLALVFSDPTRTPIDLEQLARVFSILFIGVVTLLVGAVAAAEERQLGTLPSQMLLPIAAWKQWAVKVLSASVLLGLLVGGLPMVLSLVAPIPPGGFEPWPRSLLQLYLQGTTVLGMAFVLSLYVGSLANGGLRGFLFAIGTVVAAGSALNLLVVGPLRWLFLWQSSLDGSWLGLVPVNRELFQLAYDWIPIGGGILVVGLMLRYAYLNYRSLDTPRTHLRRQLPRLVTLTVAVVLLQHLVVGTLSAAQLYQYQQRQKAAQSGK